MPFGHQKVAVQADISDTKTDTKSCLSDDQIGYPGLFLDAIRMPFSYHITTWARDTRLKNIVYDTRVSATYELTRVSKSRSPHISIVIYYIRIMSFFINRME